MSNNIQCLSCGSTMKEVMYEGVNIDRCPDCGATWLDWKELGPIIERQKKEFPEEKRVASLQERGQDPSSDKAHSCPSCGKRMEKFQYAVNSGVYLDRCPDRCGLWLDEGELEKVQVVMEEYDQKYDQPEGKETAVEIPDVKRCPRCNEALNEITYEDVNIDRCPSCNGHWCDFDELLTITETLQKDMPEEVMEEFDADEDEAEVARAEQLTPELECVICGDLMTRTNYQYTSGVIIDSCGKGHGVWLDDGELEKVQAFEEQWEDREEELVGKYADELLREKEQVEKKFEENVNVSRFGFVNRWLSSLSRMGFF